MGCFFSKPQPKHPETIKLDPKPVQDTVPGGDPGGPIIIPS
jgi:hypothetical protein